MDKPKYVEIKARTRAELEQSFASDDPNSVCDALYSAAQHEQDWRWSQTQCLRMLNHESLLVRSSALIALGEIALFRGNLDLEVVLPEMKRFENDPALGPFVEDAMDNIRAAHQAQNIDAVPVPMMGPYEAVRLLRDRFPNLIPLFSDPDNPDDEVPEPYSSYNLLAEEVSRQREDRSLVESFCSFINELASSKEHWIEEALGDMLEGLVHDEAFVARLRPYLNPQAAEKLKAAEG